VRLVMRRLLVVTVSALVALAAPVAASACPLCGDSDVVPGRSAGDSSLLWLGIIIGGGFLVMRIGGWLRMRRQSRGMESLAKGERHDARCESVRSRSGAGSWRSREVQ